jgi:transcription antitermination factor NusG
LLGLHSCETLQSKLRQPSAELERSHSSRRCVYSSKKNAEHLVGADLDRFGYTYHLFKRSISRAWHGQIVSTFRPAFPRYIMVPFELCWEVLHDVWRIISIVCFGEEVARVREREVEMLVARCGGSDVLPPELVPELYARGERVHIGGVGLIAGHDAIYDSMVEDGKLRVMIDMMGRMVPIDVDQRDVSVAVSKRRRKRRRRPGRRNRKTVLANG